MPGRALIVTIAVVLFVPILFATLGGSQGAGLAFGVVLVGVGLAIGLLGRRG